MKLMHVDFKSLLDYINKNCEGKVELVSPNMRLNLKSKIAQLVAMSEVFNAENHEIEEMEVIAYTQEDVSKLINFMIRGNK